VGVLEMIAAVTDDQVDARVVERRAGEAREMEARDVTHLARHLDRVDRVHRMPEDAPRVAPLPRPTMRTVRALPCSRSGRWARRFCTCPWLAASV
jgi:hypothetical protein